MRIGQDINMKTNIEEGYMVIEYRAKDVTKDGKIKPNAEVRFIKHWPEEFKDNGKFTKLRLDTVLTPEDVYESYQRFQSGMDSFAGYETPRQLPLTPYELLDLADVVDAYIGLDS